MSKDFEAEIEIKGVAQIKRYVNLAGRRRSRSPLLKSCSTTTFIRGINTNGFSRRLR
jgi:hypothetical protein